MKGFEAESGVIGSILIDEGVLPVVSSMLTEDDFALNANREIYKAALALQAEGKPVDPVTILSVIGESYSDYLLQTMEITPTAANAEVYAEETRKAAMWRQLKDLGSMLVDANTGDDPREAIGQIVKEAERIENMDTKRELTDPCEALLAFFDHRAKIETSAGNCVRTGYRSIDSLLGGGLLNSGLYILAARPGMGKTTFAIAIADAVAKRGESVLFVSLEMDNEQIMAKRLAGRTGIGASDLMMNRLDDEQYKRVKEASKDLSMAPFYLNRKTWATVEDVRNWARKVKGLRMIVIDYFGLLRAPGKSNSRYEAMTEISGQLKALARSLKVPILCLAQLNRENMNRTQRTPMLSDLRDTGALEQDADGVIFLHRPDYYSTESNSTSIASGPMPLNVILAKNRHGSVGNVELAFYLKTGKIVPWTYN